MPLSIVGHGAVLVFFVWLGARLPRVDTPPPSVIAHIIETPGPEPAAPTEALRETAAASEAAPSPKSSLEPIVPEPHPAAPATPSDESAQAAAVDEEEPGGAPEVSDLLSEDDLARAANTEGQPAVGSGGCDTAARLQRALRGDAMVGQAVRDAGRAGKAVMLWNGDWIRSGAQAGKGLSGVRQAIAWELAFAPENCRRQPMRGLVVVSLADGTRFAIGAGEWSWSDLLNVGRPASLTRGSKGGGRRRGRAVALARP